MTHSPLSQRQRHFLQILDLPVPGDLPAELGALQSVATAAQATTKTPLAQTDVASSVPSAPSLTPPVAREVESGRPTAPEPGVEQAHPVSSPDHAVPGIEHMDWAALESAIHACRACSLGASRQHAVVGAGTQGAPWLFVGEAPGAEEDRTGQAFVGRGGKLLDAMLQAMGLSREVQVYIANVLKCRPPQNRDPLGPEVRACLPFLQRQVALLRPRIIVALGRFAAQGLLQTDQPLGKLRGQRWEVGGIPLVVTYHPAYLLRNPVDKRKAWADLKFALSVYRELEREIPKDSKASDTL